jgi:Flp pilus assembly protein TadD
MRRSPAPGNLWKVRLAGAALLAALGAGSAAAQEAPDEAAKPAPAAKQVPPRTESEAATSVPTPELPKTLPFRFAVMAFENRTTIRALDYLRAAAAFELAEKIEQNLPLWPAYGRLVVPSGPAVAVDAKSVAAFAAGNGARYVFTGWVRRPDWKLELNVTLWKVEGGAATQLATHTATDDFNAVHVMLGNAVIALAEQAKWRLGPEAATGLRAVVSKDLYAFTLFGRGLGYLLGLDGGVVNLAAAAKDLDKATFIDPTMVEGQRIDAEVRLREGKGAKAAGKLAYVLELRPGYYAAMRDAAAGAVADGKSELSRELFDRMVRARPWDLDARYGLGNALWEAGDADGAFRELDRVVQRQPDHIGARRVLVLVHASRGSGKDLVRELEAVVKLDPRDQAARLDLGAAYLAVGRADEARATYQAVLAERPDDVTAHKLLGDLHRRAGQHPEAIAEYSKMMKLAPDDPRPYFLVAAIYLEEGKEGEARKLYQKALRFKAYVGQVYNNLGAIAYREGRLDDAYWYLKRAALKRPRSVSARYNYAMVLSARKEGEAALAEIAAGLALDPRHAGLLALRGVVMLRVGDLTEARKAFEAALSVKPDAVDARHDLDKLDEMERRRRQGGLVIETP